MGKKNPDRNSPAALNSDRLSRRCTSLPWQQNCSPSVDHHHTVGFSKGTHFHSHYFIFFKTLNYPTNIIYLTAPVRCTFCALSCGMIWQYSKIYDQQFAASGAIYHKAIDSNKIYQPDLHKLSFYKFQDESVNVKQNNIQGYDSSVVYSQRKSVTENHFKKRFAIKLIKTWTCCWWIKYILYLH